MNESESLARIDRMKERVDCYRPLPEYTATSVRDHLALEWTYESNGIEGNTLTLYETKAILEDGITVGGKALRDHLEAINHRDAIEFTEELVADEAPLDERIIKDLHALILRGIDKDEAGRYRRENVRIAGASTTPPDFLHVEEAIQQLLGWYDHPTDDHPVRHIAELHARFAGVHPFVDGNGRTGRLLMNLELMKAGYPPAILRAHDRAEYYEALDRACAKGEYEAITDMVAAGVEQSLQVYLELLEPPTEPGPSASVDPECSEGLERPMPVSPMKHRHLVDGVGLVPMAIDDIIDRGDRREWVALRDAALADPVIMERIYKIASARTDSEFSRARYRFWARFSGRRLGTAGQEYRDDGRNR